MQIGGGCHCGNIRFLLDWSPDPAVIVGRACTCDFCTKHGNVWTSKPDGRLDIEIRDSHFATQYEFGTGTAQFHVCAKCGITPVVTCAIEGRLYAVVNTNTFDAPAASLVRRVPAELGDENASGRLERRRRNWIGDVTFKPAPA